MKNVIALVLFVVLFSTAAFAVVPNPVTNKVDSNGQPSTQINVNYENQTNFGSIGAWGSTATGNPGWMVMKGCDPSNTCFPYYLWVASDGKLYIASYITISAYSSFPSGNWNRSNMAVGTAVGQQ